MNEKENAAFGDKEQMSDLLLGEKYLTGVYNTFLCECATPELTRCLSTLLSETHTMQQQTFAEMNSRGWYPVEKAEETKLQKAKNKFMALLPQ